ncbi:MATE family efflux transporter [Agathobaculum butyriciproducens]|uniref:MATE family efflux transporter n=1 Tax=Agathobaculum butyriciproducens TaxID=1628085 RepID=UPI00345E7882
MAIADGATAVISFNYGAKAYSRVRGAIRFMTQLAFGYTALSWLLISLFPAAFIRIFNQDAAMLRAAIPSLHIYFFGFVMMAFQYSGQSTFKSLNRAGFAVFFSLLRKAFIVVPLTLVLPRVAGIGVNGVFAAEPISNLIGGLACYITMRCTVMRELEHRKACSADRRKNNFGFFSKNLLTIRAKCSILT